MTCLFNDMLAAVLMISLNSSAFFSISVDVDSMIDESQNDLLFLISYLN